MTAPRRSGIHRLPALLAAISITAGIGLAALPSGADLHPRALLSDAGHAPDVVRMPRIVVAPRGASESDRAQQVSERCSHLHC